MRRWHTRIFICLALGAVTTVAVAWGLAWIHPPHHMFGKGPEHPPPSMLLSFDGAPRRIYTVRASITRESGSELVLVMKDWLTDADRASVFSDSVEESERVRAIAEWNQVHISPWRAVPYWGRRFLSVDGMPSEARVDRWLLGHGWPASALHLSLPTERRFVHSPPTRKSKLETLPLRPIWRGFLIDTLFYSIICFGLLLGFTFAKRTLRTRRGQCPSCAYDLRGDLETGCPECGWNRAEDES